MMSELGQFSEGFASWRHILGTAKPDDRLTIFGNAAREVASYVTRGLDRIVAIDELADMAIACGLVDADAVQATIAKAFKKPDPYIRDHPKPNGGAAPRFVLKSLDQLVINTAPNYLIKGLLPRVGLGVIWGWYKSGKSFSALDMALCIAHARDYHGKKTKSGPVIYIALEGGSRYPDRVKAWHMINNVPQQGAPFYLLSDVQLDLFADSAALIATIREQVAAAAPAAIFVDTLNRAIAGSENRPEDMARFVRACDALRIAFGCFVGVIHHSGAGGNDRPRGHTSLAGADDVGIAVDRDPAGLVTLHVDHIRDDASAPDLTFRLETIQVDTNDEGDPIISAAVVAVAAGRPAPKLSGYDKIAYDLLEEIISQTEFHRDMGVGEKRPSCPASFWRESFYKKHPGQDRDTKKRAFNRTVAKLQELAIIEFYDDTVWLAGQAGHGGTS
jgi:hypothetical protein